MTREELILSVDFFAVREALKSWRVSGKVTDLEDHIQAARLGVVLAANSYDPEQGSFTTWSFFHINKMLQELRRSYTTFYISANAYAEIPLEERAVLFKKPTSLEAQVYEGVTVGDKLPSPENATLAWEHTQSVKDLIATAIIKSDLTERDRDILEHLYGFNGKKRVCMAELAARHKVTRQRVHQIVNQIHSRVRRSVLRLVGNSANLVAFL